MNLAFKQQKQKGHEMKKIILTSLMTFVLGGASYANQDIAVTVDSLTNVTGNGAMEACGTAKHSDGVKPLLVTLNHSESYYTTLSGPNDKWCVVVKRWTFNGKVQVSATTLQSAEDIHFQTFNVKVSEK